MTDTGLKTALVAGYTGLVGRELLAQMLELGAYGQIKTVGRKPPQASSAQLEAVVTELGDLAPLTDQLAADDVFCCLGTTLRAAGSREAFERVDLDMVVDLARVAYAAGARRFFLLSALSANPQSSVFYNRIKGRVESAVREIGYDTLHIVRPSLLLGKRPEARFAEDIGQCLMPMLNPLLRGRWAKYRAVCAKDVASALLELAERKQTGVIVSTLPLR